MSAQDSDSEWLLVRSGLFRKRSAAQCPRMSSFESEFDYRFFTLVKSEYAPEGILKSDSLLMTS